MTEPEQPEPPKTLSGVTADDVINLYAASIRELDESQHAYMAAGDEATFRRFWLARERYQVLSARLARDMLLNDAVEAYRP